MTISTPVDQVVDLLREAGFSLLDSPLTIAGVRFEFPAVLLGPQNSSDLVLVADTAGDVEDVFTSRQVLSVARALDVVEKCNPITTVIVGPRPDKNLISDMMAVSRVLAIGPLDETDEDSDFSPLHNWLAVLLPLRLETDTLAFDPLDRLRTELASEQNGEMMEVLDAAEDSQAAVRNVMNKIIKSSLVHFEDGEA